MLVDQVARSAEREQLLGQVAAHGVAGAPGPCWSPQAAAAIAELAVRAPLGISRSARPTASWRSSSPTATAAPRS